MLNGTSLLILYRRLYESYGAQHWWPAESPFEVMLGAVLTQNTAWRNVEMALANLRRHDCMGLTQIQQVDSGQLADWIRPSGYYKLKAKRIKNLCQWLQDNGGIENLSGRDTTGLRVALLQVNGVGPETADDILLYALHRPVFVIDAYTRRLFKRMRLISGDEAYEVLRAQIETALGADTALFNEYHALIVRHAKQKCSCNTSAPVADCLRCFVEAGLENEAQTIPAKRA